MRVVTTREFKIVWFERKEGEIRLRPIVIVVLLAALLPALVGAQFITNFNSLDEPFYVGEAGRVSLNASCWGYTNEFMQGDLIRWKVEAKYFPFNETVLLKQSFALYEEPCAELSNQVFLLSFPINSTSASITAYFSRADYPLNYWTQSFSSEFPVKEKPKPVNASEFSGGELLDASGAGYDLPKPDWLIWLALALGLIATVLLFFFRSLKWSLIFLFLMGVTGAYYILA